MPGQPEHTITLTEYEVANLREALSAVGCGSPWHVSPLNAMNTGDWVCQVWAKLPQSDHWLCQTAEVMSQRAREWRPR